MIVCETETFTEQRSHIMREATVGHLLRGEGPRTEILIGERTSLFFNGLLGCPGGKFSGNEGMNNCLDRELREEIGVHIVRESVTHIASVNYFHPGKAGPAPEWRVHFLEITEWKKEPQPLEGFKSLIWVPLAALPYEKMNVDLMFWLPCALSPTHRNGHVLEVDIVYNDPELTKVSRCGISFKNGKEK